MRIYLFLGGLGSGGAQRQFLQLAQGARERGHAVRLGVVQPGGGRFWDEASGRGYVEPLWADRSRSKPTTAWRFATAWRRLRRSVRDFEADVLYSALYPSNVLARLAARAEDTPPLVWGIRSSDLPRRWPREMWLRLGAAVSGGVELAIANSRAGVEHHRHRRFRPARWATVPNGIDTDRFRPDPRGRRRLRREWDVGADDPLVGLVGRLVPMKGHRDFLAAAAAVRSEHATARFVCVGGGPRGRRRRLERMAVEMNVAGVVRWVGERRDMPAVYSALDLLVLASRHGEGFPNVVGEAMACGTPCVVTSVGDAPEIVGSLGRVVPPGRPGPLASAIADRLARASAAPGRDAPSSREGRTPESDRLRRHIVTQFSTDLFVKRTLELLEEIADRSADDRSRGTRKA